MLIIPTYVSARELNYINETVTLVELKENMKFKVLEPKEIPPEWSLEIKVHPRAVSFTMYFMDNKDVLPVLSIQQSKEKFLKQDIDRNLTDVKINNHKGFYEEWGSNIDHHGKIITGGILRWEQEGTYIEMSSVKIPKDIMIVIAKSLEEL
jgi:hypothetical protein